jgi:branched-chain amino acid transport system permease protein
VLEFAVAALNGISYGLLLFMLSAGLTLIFSMLGVLNFAHASFYMLGAYLGYSIAAHAGFATALVCAPLVVGIVGVIVERALLRRARANGPLHELLLTFGLAYLLAELVKLVWGLGSVSMTLPSVLNGPLATFGGAAFSRYRAFMMAVSVSTLAASYLLLRTSRTGLVLRAALTHARAVEALGHDVARIGTLVFAVGTAFAALAGVIGAPLAVVEPGMADAIGSIVFVVVIVGGLGSLGGAFAASLSIGCLQTWAAGSSASLGSLTQWAGVRLPPAWTALSVSQAAPLLPYVLLVAMLACRPRGLFGRREDDA